MNSPDDLDELFSRLRATPPAGDPERVSPGFETRVIARLRTGSPRAGEGLAWFWRWSAIFGTAAVACGVLVFQSYQALLDDSLIALEGGGALLSWFF